MTNYLIKQLFYFIPDILTFFLVEKYRLLKTFDDGVVRQHAQLQSLNATAAKYNSDICFVVWKIAIFQLGFVNFHLDGYLHKETRAANLPQTMFQSQTCIIRICSQIKALH